MPSASPAFASGTVTEATSVKSVPLSETHTVTDEGGNIQSPFSASVSSSTDR